MPRRNRVDYETAVKSVRKKNNRMIVRKCRYYMLQLAIDMVAIAFGRQLTTIKRSTVWSNEQYLLDEYLSDED